MLSTDQPTLGLFSKSPWTLTIWKCRVDPLSPENDYRWHKNAMTPVEVTIEAKSAITIVLRKFDSYCDSIAIVHQLLRYYHDSLFIYRKQVSKQNVVYLLGFSPVILQAGQGKHSIRIIRN